LFSEEDDVTVKSTFCYNTLTNVWTTLAPMPVARMDHGVCVVSGMIYTIGGQSTLLQDASAPSSVYRFDSAANLWSTVAPALSPRVHLATFVLGGSLYVAGGYYGSICLASVERYDVASDRWEVVSNMALSEARVGFGAQVITLEVSLFDSLESKARRALI
jgi:N-acetylneuraminic acid mutarotase